jgi:hypothetical protein
MTFKRLVYESFIVVVLRLIHRAVCADASLYGCLLIKAKKTEKEHVHSSAAAPGAGHPGAKC